MASTSFSYTHPQFDDYEDTFQLLRDSFLGERCIKSRGTTYLPYTAGMTEFGAGSSTGKTDGDKLYEAYKQRAVYHDDFKRTVRALMGLMHREDANIELPTALEDLRDNATPNGETLQVLLRRINEEQFTTGRFGLQLDVDAARPLPYLVGWQAEHIRNWNEINVFRDNQIEKQLRWVILDESRYEPNALQTSTPQDDGGLSRFAWTAIDAYRLLSMNDAGQYMTQVERRGVLLDEIVPTLSGRAYEGIPFWIANAVDMVRDIGEPPLEGLARLMLAVYRGEADYRETLHKIGQDTLVIIGAPLPEEQSGQPTEKYTGANAIIEVPEGGDAKYIGVSGDGLSEQREALASDRKEAGQYGSMLFDSERGAETGEALDMRASGRTATLKSIAKTGAATLEAALKGAAVWVGANPDDVRVDPNLDFLNNEMTAEELGSLMGAKMLGAPLSMATIHARMRARGMTEQEYEDELALIQEEISNGTFDPMAGQDRDQAGEDDEDDDDGNDDDADE